MVRLTVEQGSAGLMFLMAAALLGAIAWLARGTYRRVPAARWWTLLGLKGAATVLAVFLLFKPVLSLERAQSQRRHLVFLMDRSASMRTADDATGRARFDRARALALDWSARLARSFETHWLTFADRAETIEGPGDLGTIEPTGEATSLTRALAAATKAAPARDIEAVIVVSDGLHNAAGDPRHAARALGVVVHAVGVGNSLKDAPSYRDARVTALDCPDTMPVHNQAKVVARVEQTGLAGQVVPVVLKEDEREVGRVEVELRDAGAEAVFSFVPTEIGRHQYRVEVPASPGEKIAENNQRAAIARVVEARLRVLYLEGTLRAEFGAIVQRFLSKDPDIEFCALVQTRPNVFTQRTNIAGLDLKSLPTDTETLGRFDVVVIGDLDATYWKGDALGLLATRVRDGAGLLMLGGYRGLGPGGYGNTPLSAILPVDLGGRDVGQLTEAFLPQLTPEGVGHPIFSGISAFFPSVTAPPQRDGLPPLDGCTRIGAARPAASVLALAPGEGDGRPMPVLAVAPVEKGRVAVFCGDTTRNWQQAPRALGQETPFTRFWGQALRWLANRSDEGKDKASVVASTDRATYEPDAAITVRATVRDTQGEGTDKASVRAIVRGPRGAKETLELAAVAGATGQYQATLTARPPGVYEIEVTAGLGDLALKAAPIAAEVGRPNLEFDRLDLDEATLGKMTAASGGQYRHISAAESLLTLLDRSERLRRVAWERPLAEPRLGWALVVGLLAAEWALRKRSQLR